MGIFIRKSFNVGPVKVNLSKSGIGVSAGVKGFRVGRGPNGNYIHTGRKGLYYKTNLPNNPKAIINKLISTIKPANMTKNLNPKKLAITVLEWGILEKFSKLIRK
ncbi:MAG: hypothetical protein A2287_09320 [Candidatus Melainabacteria bacterium RIFOXYA12_FULL_32_12]|nr:MAG: hypothetical protein A2287_09320 [Candidatus Melainabacteria bacterium RIFOXYA12_FULL_32_12]